MCPKHTFDCFCVSAKVLLCGKMSSLVCMHLDCLGIVGMSRIVLNVKKNFVSVTGITESDFF